MKQFDINPSKGSRVIERTVDQALEETTTQWTKPEATPEEALMRRERLQTRGKRGAKAYRLCLQVTPSNEVLIKALAHAKGQTHSRVINDILHEYAETHADELKAAQKAIRAYRKAVGLSDED